MRILKKVVIVLCVLVVSLSLTLVTYIYIKLNSIHEEKEIMYLENYDYINEDVVNILLVGVDGENMDKGNRSDAIMILTIDNKNKDIRLTSIARDTLVDIPGYSDEKLNHAYAYEGAELLLQTINENFGVPIEKYITVSFKSFMDIVDKIGGVEVYIDEKNIEIMNDIIDETYHIYSENKDVEPVELIKQSGKQTINGYQALSFGRIRYTDNGYERDKRQREVISSAYSKLLNQNIETIKKAVDIVLGNCKTNIAPLEMIEIGIKAYNIKDNEIEQLEFPLNSHREDVLKDGKGWVTEWDIDYNKEVLKDFIFNNIN